MNNRSNNSKSTIIGQNIAFYNEIAGSYDNILDKDIFNKLVLEKVAEKFCSIVKSGQVLDFGGGTGRDLDWLTNNNYHIFFCEPSVAMREKAIEYNQTILHNDTIVFLDYKTTDFTTWQYDLSLLQKMDAVLSNFAVFNCIPDIELLFKSLSTIVKPGGHLLALILDNRFRKVMRSHFKSAVRSFIFRTPVQFNVRFNQHQQTVYIHTTGQIKKASETYFDFHNQEFLREYGYSLIHLIRK